MGSALARRATGFVKATSNSARPFPRTGEIAIFANFTKSTGSFPPFFFCLFNLLRMVRFLHLELLRERYVPSRNRRLNYVLGSQKGVINMLTSILHAKAERHGALDSSRGSSDDRQLQPHNEVVSIPLIAPDFQMHSNKVSLPYQAPLIFSSVASDTHREEGMKDQKKIRLGMIGVGNWAKFAHLRVLRLLPEYE